ncbi:hypothetical protein HFP15_03500 [Amycolatopsis sp. K13G38]|uniref:Uncharacterized protein n=1 Tax=Amycolatopsis acididurans TaxID=2724524 RepID=A0ABX1IWU9_9PSEU|nr:hypothetical protein [Amycolatopsis acididurans]NKQ51943.1 hypothetical protein [Amycolatopsis acididurans]
MSRLSSSGQRRYDQKGAVNDDGVEVGCGIPARRGRSKDIINRGSEKFSTMDIELALASGADIEAVAVTSVPDARLAGREDISS